MTVGGAKKIQICQMFGLLRYGSPSQLLSSENNGTAIAQLVAHGAANLHVIGYSPSITFI